MKTIDTYILKEYATEEVAYGINYFGKIKIDDEKFIHVRYSALLNLALQPYLYYILRAHKSNDGSVELYSIKTDGTAIWSEDEPLKYFID